MKPQIRRSTSLLGLLVTLVAVIGAAQVAKFPTGVFKGNDGTNTISLDFDTTGVVTAYVNAEVFSNSRYEAVADTVKFGPVNGPEGYSCANAGTYTWKLAENRLSFAMVTDDCAVRSTTLINLIWTR
jgi:hypothetical protein